MLQTSDARNRDLIVNVNGILSHRDQAAVSPFDSVVQGGDAVWEGLRLYGGKIFRLDEHLARLRSSARALAFARIPSDEEITGEIRRTLAANGMHDGVHALERRLDPVEVGDVGLMASDSLDRSTVQGA